MGGSAASVHLPGTALAIADIGGPRIMLATSPQVADDFEPADRDLALRLANRDLASRGGPSTFTATRSTTGAVEQANSSAQSEPSNRC